MDIRDAANICRPLDKRTFRDQTLDLADKLIGEERARQAAEIAAADVGRAFLDACYELEGCAINLRAYTRGMLCRDFTRSEIAKARAALEAMEGALQ